MMHETHARSVAKGISWRMIASATTMSLVYFFTGSLALVASVGVLEMLTKLFFYYLHERAWGKVAWGKVRINS